MEHNNGNKNDQNDPPPPYEELSNEDLLFQIFMASLIDQLHLLDVNDRSSNLGNAATPTTIEDDSATSDSQSRLNSPPFEPPASWAYIDRARAERVANETNAGTMRATKQEHDQIELSLSYRGSLVRRAKDATTNNQ